MVDVYVTTPRSGEHHKIEYAIRKHMGDLWPEAVDQFLYRPKNQLLYCIEEEQVEPLLSFLRQLEAEGRVSEVFIDDVEDGADRPSLEKGQANREASMHALDLAFTCMKRADTQNCFQSQEVVEAVIAALAEAKQRLEEGPG